MLVVVRGVPRSLHCGPQAARASGRDGMTMWERKARGGLVLWGGLHDYGVGLADIGIVNLVGVEEQVAFELQIHG
jgi:hypothetical protein